MIRSIPLSVIGLVGLLLAVDGITAWVANAPMWSWGIPWALGTAFLAGAFFMRIGRTPRFGTAVSVGVAIVLLALVGVFGFEIGGIKLSHVGSIAGFLVLTIGTVAVGIFTMLRGRASSEGANVWVYVVAGLAVVVMVNYIASRHVRQRWDLTQAQLESLAEQTTTKLRGLESNVHAIAFFRDDHPSRNSYAELLRRYTEITPYFTFEMVDPDKYPDVARQENIQSTPMVVLKSETGRRELVPGPYERDLTSALIKVTRPGTSVIYFSSWHGERSLDGDLSQFVSSLEQLNYKVEPWQLTEEDIPLDASVFAVIGPRAPFAPVEIERIEDFVARGNKLLVMLDPDTVQVGIEDLLSRFGAKVLPNAIIERQRGLVPRSGGYYMGEQQSVYARATEYAEDPIVIDLHERGVATGFYLAREVQWRGPTRPELRDATGGSIVHAGSRLALVTEDVGELLTNPRQTFSPADDRTGPFPVGVALTAPATDPLTPEDAQTRIVVFGDSDFITDRGVGQEQGNLTLGLNAVNWLAEDQSLIAIQPREPGYKPLRLTRAQSTFIFLFSVWRFPAFVLVIGMLIWWYRRSRGPTPTKTV